MVTLKTQQNLVLLWVYRIVGMEQPPKNHMDLSFMLSSNEVTVNDLQNRCDEYISDNRQLQKRKHVEILREKSKICLPGDASCCLFKHQSALFKHAQKHYIDGKYKCPCDCGEFFVKPTHWCHHLADAHQLFHLCQCRKLVALDKVDSHICKKKGKPIVQRAIENIDSIMCGCNRKYGRSKSAIRNHFREWHACSMGYQCPYCASIYKSCKDIFFHIHLEHFKIDWFYKREE